VANRKSRLILLLGVLVLLGAVAWGVGWGARVFFDRWAAPPPTATAEPTALPMATPADLSPTILAIASPSPLAQQPARTLVSTVTPIPTPVSSPTPQFRTYVTRDGEGLAAIARIVCPNLVTYQDREDFAFQIQHYNPGKIQNIDVVREGIELVIPPCP
jgi:hypothetical protein